MVQIDIGCGYLYDLHYPSLDAEIGLDMNLHLSDSKFLELWKDKHLIRGSAECLPFRNNISKGITLRALIEHLEKPIDSLKETRRVLKRNSGALITIPIIVSHQKDYLQKMFLQFPFAIWDVYKCMKRMHPHLKTKGFYHQADIKPKHVVKYFRMFNIRTIRYRHKWFYGIWGKCIKRMLTNGKEPLLDKQGYYEILVIK